MAGVQDMEFNDVRQQEEMPSVYCTNHKYRGIATIVGFQEFKDKELNLECTTSEIRKVRETFQSLQFLLDVWNGPEEKDGYGMMTKENFLRKLDQVASEDFHKDADCYALFIVTHGGEHDKMLAYDDSFTVQEVYERFAADKCPNLAGKPKFFIFNACRGIQMSIEGYGSGYKYGNCFNRFSIPAEADFLFMFSTFKGKKAFVSENACSGFISALTTVLDEDMEKEDVNKQHVLDLMTHVCRRTACFKWRISGKMVKQQPTIVSTMLKSFYLHKKLPVQEGQ